jgi:hypothetical protein
VKYKNTTTFPVTSRFYILFPLYNFADVVEEELVSIICCDGQCQRNESNRTITGTFHVATVTRIRRQEEEQQKNKEETEEETMRGSEYKSVL